jgi:hypothetical protein
VLINRVCLLAGTGHHKLATAAPAPGKHEGTDQQQRASTTAAAARGAREQQPTGEAAAKWHVATLLCHMLQEGSPCADTLWEHPALHNC